MRQLLTRSGALLSVAAVFAVASPAKAEQTSHIGIDMRLGTMSEPNTDVFHLQPTLFGDMWFSPKLHMTAEWGVAYSSISSSTDSSNSDLAFSNPVLAAHYLLMDGGVQLTAGAGVGIPFLKFSGDMSTPSGRSEALASLSNIVAARSVRGRPYAPLWVTDTVTFFVPVRASVKFTNGLWLRGDLDLNFYIPTIASGSDAGALMALDLAYRVGGYVPGVRLTGDWLFTGDRNDNFQSALELYMRINFTWGFARAAFLMNLDKPMGLSFDDGKFWGLGLRAGFNI